MGSALKGESPASETQPRAQDKGGGAEGESEWGFFKRMVTLTESENSACKPGLPGSMLLSEELRATNPTQKPVST